MQSPKEPHLAHEPQVADLEHNGWMSAVAPSHAVQLHVLVIHYFLSHVITPLNQYGGGLIAFVSTLSERCGAAVCTYVSGERSPPHHLSVICLFHLFMLTWKGLGWNTHFAGVVFGARHFEETLVQGQVVSYGVLQGAGGSREEERQDIRGRTSKYFFPKIVTLRYETTSKLQTSDAKILQILVPEQLESLLWERGNDSGWLRIWFTLQTPEVEREISTLILFAADQSRQPLQPCTKV